MLPLTPITIQSSCHSLHCTIEINASTTEEPVVEEHVRLTNVYIYNIMHTQNIIIHTYTICLCTACKVFLSQKIPHV